MTIAHKNLTGTDLHEIKGASAATAGQVPIADGLGGAPFGTITIASLGPTANPFGSALFHCIEQQAAGTNSVVTQITAWTTQTYTDVLTNEIATASQSGGGITLPAGTYFVNAFGSYKAQSNNGVPVSAQCRLYNASTGAVVLPGTSQQSIYSIPSAAVVTQNQIGVTGRFTLSAPSDLLFQLYVSSQGNLPAGSIVGAGGNIVYTSVQFWKIA